MKKTFGIVLSALMLLASVLPCFAPATNEEFSESGYIVKLNQGQEAPELLEISAEAGLYKAESLSQIRALGDAVEYFEPDGKAELVGLTNDKFSDEQWNLSQIGIITPWGRNYTGSGVRVAVIDSGINKGHEDFKGASIAKGSNMLDGSSDVTDDTGHGTFVAGVLAAQCNNELGIAGLCDDVTIVPIKCFSGRETDLSYIVSAIYEAVDIYDCDIINLSLGSGSNTTSLRQAVDYAVGKGVIIISAVGNNGTTKYQYPAAYGNVIGVGSVGRTDGVSGFSQRNDSVFVTAPGEDVCGLGNDSSSAYVKGEGTSYSTPHVTAAAVIMKQFAPNSDYEDLAELLKQTSKDLGKTGFDTSYGWGRLDLTKFVEAMEAYSFVDIGEVFPDVANHWSKEYVEYVYNMKYFNGYEAGVFAPDKTMTRGMFVTVLSRMSGENISGYTNVFTDVASDAYYAQACAWGAAKGIVSGLGGGKFNPDGVVTREQMAAFLYRYAAAYGTLGESYGEAVIRDYADNGSISGWARTAMIWAVGSGHITGRDGNKLYPADSAKRGEVATMITRFATNVA